MRRIPTLSAPKHGSAPKDGTWTDDVALPGVVFIGDTAGYNDAIIGEGLSIALRDARSVADVIDDGGDWSPEAFGAHASERQERMRRLRICAFLETELRCTFTPRGRARRGAFFAQLADDPTLALPTFVTGIAGPDIAPPEAFEAANLERILALG